jgi:RNA polymerase-binding transcription factor DksA
MRAKRELEKISVSENWQEAARRLREEEHALNATLAASEAFPTEKIIDDWQERNSLNYEEALRQRLAQIRDALLRLCQQTYGNCIECGKKIDKKRLMTDPAISRCLACQHAIEDQPRGRY